MGWLRITSTALATLALSFVVPSMLRPALANQDVPLVQQGIPPVPATGLHVQVRETGKISLSADGAGTIDPDGVTFQVNEPISAATPITGGSHICGAEIRQFSRTEVNGQRLTSCVGSADDGQGAGTDGLLIITGGIGNDRANPTDPFLGGSHSIANVVFNPPSPAALNFNQFVDLTFDYTTSESTGVRIFARPVAGGALAPNYAAHPSPLHPTGAGSGDGFFTITSGAVLVDQVRFQMWNADQSTLLYQTFFTVSYQFGSVNEEILLAPLSATREVGESHTVTATLQDDNGNPIANRQVTFEIQSGPNAVLTDTVETPADGKALFTYTGTKPGTDTMVASFVDSQGNLHVSDPPVTATWTPVYSVTVAPPIASRDVGTQHTVTATVVDRQQNPVPGLDIDFTVGGANTTSCVDNPPTDSNGQTTCTYTGDNVGGDTITAWVDETDNNLLDSGEFSGTATITWEPVYIVTLTPPTAVRDVGTPHTGTATVVDHRESPVPGLDVDFTVSGANSASCFDNPPTDSNGQTTCTYTGDNVGGDTIIAWVDENDNNRLDPDEFSDTATVSWMPVYTITLTPPTAVRDVGMQHTVTATVVDHHANPVSDLGLHFQVTGINTPTQIIPVSAGQAVFTYQGKTNQSGTDTITAWIEENGNNLPDLGEFSAPATVVWRRIGITMEGQGVGDAVSVVRTVTATVENDILSVVQGVEVGFQVTGGTTFGTDPKPTNVNGQAVFTYTSRAPAPAGVGASMVPGTSMDTELTQQIAAPQADIITVWVDLLDNRVPDSVEPQISVDVPTAVTLVSFTAQRNDNSSISLLWETATEFDNAGFNLYRSMAVDQGFVKINDRLIAAQGNGAGARYSYVDTPPGDGSFYYKLEDLDFNGVSTFHGPLEVRAALNPHKGQEQVYLPLIRR